jgi:hypothetical protein
VQGRRAAPSQEIPPLVAGFELPALVVEVAVALEGGGEGETLLPTGLYHRPTQIVGIEPDDHLDAGRGRALPDQLGRQLRGLAEGELQGRAVRLFDREPETIGQHVVAEDQDAADVLVASHVRVDRRVFPLGDRIHGLAPFGLLRIIDDEIERLSRLWVQGSQQLPGLLTEGCLRVPPLHEEEVVEAGPMALDIQIPVHIGHMAPAPREGHHQDQQAKVVEMGPMNAGAQGEKKLVERGGHAYDAKHGGNSPQPRVNGRYIHYLAVGRELPLLPSFVKPQPLPCLKKSVNMSI